MRNRTLLVTTGLAALIPLLATPALAQRRPATPPQQAQEQADPNATLRLSANVRGVRSEGTISQNLAIEVLDLQVRLRGSVAETRMTATFRNAGDDVLEGDFLFDMPAGSVITGYALDVGPDLVDGVLAGRDQAREAYARRVAQRIDPGLAEVTWSDRFSTRIFPIPARGSRTIRLIMTSPIDPQSGFVLPMRPSGSVGRLTMRIVSDDGTPPAAVLPSGVSGRWQDGTLSVDAWNVRLSGEFRLPAPVRRDAFLVSSHANGERFFDLEDRLPTDTPGQGGTPPVHIIWDRSVSRVDDDLAGEKALLLAHLESTGARIAGLTLFDSSGAETLRPADAGALSSALDAIHYGGGTSFALLSGLTVETGAL
jgi:hypothetical protein